MRHLKTFAVILVVALIAIAISNKVAIVGKLTGQQ